MWDLHCAFALLAWRQRTGSSARRWLESLGEVEALAAFGAFSMENPEFAFPELATAPCYVATGLGHPLLGPSRVTNDVRLAGPGTALVVTGSNMSGKSTLLRSLGINAVLAQVGAPVCAQSMVLGPGAIATSMRIRDSLEHGISHFYAEVQKLKGVVDRARQETVLFLLDEILHGTNSRERLIGARAVLRELLRCGALGGVSTHDLALGDLEQELPEKVANVHFQEQVQGDRMTFDYRLRQGVVTSSNALRLMRMVGIDVVPLQADEP
jgi:DNA mismatch repair ATPase MutS